MRFSITLLTGLLAGALPLAGRAQTGAPAAFKPQLFVGLGAAVGSLQSPTTLAENTIAPALTAGVQLRPRLSVQASAQYFQRTDSYFHPGIFFFNGGLHQGLSYSTSRWRMVVVPVLARYTLTRRPAQRIQVDVLGGVAFARSTYRGQSTTVDSLQNAVRNDDDRYASNNLYLSLGPSLHCRLGAHLELTGDLVFNFLVNQHPYNSTSSTAALGLRYRFGRS